MGSQRFGGRVWVVSCRVYSSASRTTRKHVWSKELVKKSTKAKTYNSGYSLVVTHLTTNPPVPCLNMAERTGSLVFMVLW